MGRALTIGEQRQFQQWLGSYVAVRGHEPFAHEIADFEARNRLTTRGLSPCLTAQTAGNVLTPAVALSPPGMR
jgi:hypothetical protein